MAKVSNDEASHHFKCSASLFCECVRVIISDQLLMEHQTFSFLKEKPSNRKHVLVHRWIKIKISYTEDVTLQRFNEETEVTVADNLQATTGSLFPGTENDGDWFKKKKKSLAYQDEVAWGQSGREKEMKGGQVRYIYIMWLKGRGGWSPSDRHSDVVGVERRLYTL